MAALAVDWLTHFSNSSQERLKGLLQTCHNCSFWGLHQGLLLFKSIWNPIWPFWPLICWHIFNFFSRTADGIYYKLATNVLYDVPIKCCCFLSRSEIQYADLVSVWLAHFELFLKTVEVIYSKLATHVPYEVLTKCCYF